jgi:hypothetical protein
MRNRFITIYFIRAKITTILSLSVSRDCYKNSEINQFIMRLIICFQMENYSELY